MYLISILIKSKNQVTGYNKMHNKFAKLATFVSLTARDAFRTRAYQHSH